MKTVSCVLLSLQLFCSSPIVAQRSRTHSDFLFPNSNIVFPGDTNFEEGNVRPTTRPSSGRPTEYNVCRRDEKNRRQFGVTECYRFRNTNNGEWWSPKLQNDSESVPDGYSGFSPHHWKDQLHAYNHRGERERRKSESRYKEYIESTFGDGEYDENKILTPAELNGREIADPGQFPHIAAIGVRQPDRSTSWRCTGSLISEDFVVTAAHCTDFNGEAPNWVKLGDINLNIREGVVATQRFRIDRIYAHPNYTADFYYDDIALLKLSRSAVFTLHVYPIRIWPQRDIPFERAFAMGYGATQFGRLPTGVLSYFNFTLIGNKECNRTLAHIPETPFGIIDTQICAVNTENSADTCQGDSGGPLQLNLPGAKRPKYFLIGITSYGLVCGSSLPSVYTRLHSYLPWIEKLVWPD